MPRVDSVCARCGQGFEVEADYSFNTPTVCDPCLEVELYESERRIYEAERQWYVAHGGCFDCEHGRHICPCGWRAGDCPRHPYASKGCVQPAELTRAMFEGFGAVWDDGTSIEPEELGLV